MNVDRKMVKTLALTRTQIDQLTHKVNKTLSIVTIAVGTVTFLISISCLIFLFYLMR